MNFAMTPEQESIRESVARICQRFDDHYWMVKDKEGGFPHELYDALAADGWLGVCTPEAYGGSGLGVTEATIVVKNFLDVPTVYEIKLVCPPGIRIDPSVATLRVEAGGFRRLPVKVSAANDAVQGLALVAIDVSQDGVRRGQLFDVIVNCGSG